jgi:hypothetical protein
MGAWIERVAYFEPRVAYFGQHPECKECRFEVENEVENPDHHLQNVAVFLGYVIMREMESNPRSPSTVMSVHRARATEPRRHGEARNARSFASTRWATDIVTRVRANGASDLELGAPSRTRSLAGIWDPDPAL